MLRCNITDRIMPLLPSSSPRRLEHTRHVTCQGFEREDGLWDIEGHITDAKSRPFRVSDERDVAEGEFLHEMWLRLTIDDRLTVLAVEAVTDHSPHHICPSITPAFQKLVGLSIAKGWNQAVRERLGGTAGCTHLVELLGPMATTAFQTLAHRVFGKTVAGGPGSEAKRTHPPALVNSCHAWSASGALVKKVMPQFYSPADKPAGE